MKIYITLNKLLQINLSEKKKKKKNESQRQLDKNWVIKFIAINTFIPYHLTRTINIYKEILCQISSC